MVGFFSFFFFFFGSILTTGGRFYKEYRRKPRPLRAGMNAGLVVNDRKYDIIKLNL